MSAVLGRIYEWFLGSPSRTWAAHFLLAIVLSLAFSPWAAAVFYLLREVEQSLLLMRETGDFDGKDAVLDVIAPMLGAWLVALTGWLA